MGTIMRSDTHEVEVIRLKRDRSVQRLKCSTLPDRYLVGYFPTTEALTDRIGADAVAALQEVPDGN